MNITVLFPTEDESKFFTRKDVTVAYCGVGLIASAFGTYKAIEETKPDLIIMGGIAGVYTHSHFKIGDVTLVKEEKVADLGLFYPEGFRHLNSSDLDMSFEVTTDLKCPYVREDFGLELAVSNSMNCGMAPFVDIEGIDIENMEGGSFFYVCKQLQVPFLQVRSISNEVDLNRGAWEYEKSIKALAKGLNMVVDQLKGL